MSFDFTSLLASLFASGALSGATSGGGDQPWINPDTGAPLAGGAPASGAGGGQQNLVGGMFGGEGVTPERAAQLAQIFGGMAGSSDSSSWAGVLAKALGSGLSGWYGDAASEAEGERKQKQSIAQSGALSKALESGIVGLSPEQNEALQTSGLGIEEVSALAKLMQGGQASKEPKQVFDPATGKTIWSAPGRPDIDGKVVGYSNYPKAGGAGGSADGMSVKSPKIVDFGDGVPRYYAPGTELHKMKAAQVRGAPTGLSLAEQILGGDGEGDVEPEVSAPIAPPQGDPLSEALKPGAPPPVIETDRPVAQPQGGGALDALGEILSNAPSMATAGPVQRNYGGAQSAMPPPAPQAPPAQPPTPVTPNNEATAASGGGMAGPAVSTVPAAPQAPSAPLTQGQHLDAAAIRQQPPGTVVTVQIGGKPRKMVVQQDGSLKPATQ